MSSLSQTKILAKIFCLKQETAEDDEKHFRDFWGKVENCHVLKNDQKKYTKEEFVEELIKLKDKCGSYECLVLAVSSHGWEKEHKDIEVYHEIVWNYKQSEQSFSFRDLLKIFDEKDFTDKKKIFLMQMCRHRSNKKTIAGKGEEHGVLFRSGTEPNVHTLGSNLISPSKSAVSLTSDSDLGAGSPWPKTWKIPQLCIKNSVVLYSAPSGYKSQSTLYRLNDAGGWIYVCMNALKERIKGQIISIIDLFVMLNKEMSEKEENEYIGMSSFNHMLTEDIFIKLKKD